ncbi:MAG: putative zinc-binding protein [Desulfatiglandales bacterium]
MENTCCASPSQVMLLCCSGGSNVGQLSNQASVELTQEAVGKMYCLSGIGANLSGFVASAKDSPIVVVIDGCEIGCSKKVMENAGIPLRNYIVVTQLGISKNHDFNLKREDVQKVKDEVRKILQGQVTSVSDELPKTVGCCC